jgi:hypothetical protein
VNLATQVCAVGRKYAEVIVLVYNNKFFVKCKFPVGIEWDG